MDEQGEQVSWLIPALGALKHEAPNHPRGVGFNEGLEAAVEAVRQREADQEAKLGAVDDLAVAMISHCRPDVQREVIADFMAGKSPQTLYLSVSPEEFRAMAGYLIRRHDAHYPDEFRRLAGVTTDHPKETAQCN